jgi:hypothetical protein
VRASSRIANGTRVALQNGRFQLIGRWRAGPLGFNLSKTGVSGSLKNGAGSFNFVKPQYSSFKMAGLHLRGQKAANLQIAYMLVTGALFLAALTLRFALAVAWLLVLGGCLSGTCSRDLYGGLVRATMAMTLSGMRSRGTSLRKVNRPGFTEESNTQRWKRRCKIRPR